MIYTGGTIGMRPGHRGLEPGHDFEQRARVQLDRLPAERRAALPRFHCLAYRDPIDSSNTRPEHWARIAHDVLAHQHEYDGFVILHGTDTLAWTAASLSWQLAGLNKPIIVSGAQQPLEVESGDALANLEQALRFAACPGLAEVAVAFGGRLLRGDAARKWDTHAHQGFASPNANWLGEWLDHAPVLHVTRSRPPEGVCRPMPWPLEAPPRVARLALWPGIDSDMMARLLTPELQGLVLEVWGSGNVPEDPALLALLSTATRRGCLIVAISQCPHGSLAMTSYATGHALRTAGVIDGGAMTPEAVFTRLSHLLSLGLSPQQCRHHLVP
ncbi:L-asparaginase [Kushneria sinocarnis]|uniref:L-asparaginase n=1 Tax=Kushneria sinocarnis TaxID=595502 RepID=A0A420WYI2_9GAMM|nr:asparaginase [Kushneria sinocarnis]RKR06282.1 L-asparaginase [Kushneria sinocarnis]